MHYLYAHSNVLAMLTRGTHVVLAVGALVSACHELLMWPLAFNSWHELAPWAWLMFMGKLKLNYDAT